MVKSCFVKRCGNTSNRNPDKQYFRYPKNSNSYLCSDHIPRDCIGKKKLKVTSYTTIGEMLRSKNIDVPSVNVVRKRKKFSSKMCLMDHCKLTNLSIPKVKFFEFPKNSVLCEQWIQRSNLSDRLKLPMCKYLCEKHFDSTCYANKRIKKTAIPNRFLTPEPTNNAEFNKTFTDETLFENKESRYFFKI